MKKIISVTKDEYDAYERVRKLGKYDMLDTRALQTSGLGYDTYKYIMENYEDISIKLKGGENEIIQ